MSKETDTFARRRTQRAWVFVLLGILTVLAALISVVLGQYYVPLSDLFPILAAGHAQDSLTASVVWDIRLPRLVLGLVVGAALGVAGTLMQAVFANPLAEPSIIGVTSGAGVGAAVVIVFNIEFFGTFTVPAAAFLTALLVTFIIYQLARYNGRVAVVHLILTGIAINAVCNAIISFMVYLAPTANREAIVFWQMGSLNGSQWKHVWAVLPIVVVGLAVALRLGKQLDVLALGERAAAPTRAVVGDPPKASEDSSPIAKRSRGLAAIAAHARPMSRPMPAMATSSGPRPKAAFSPVPPRIPSCTTRHYP